MDDENELERAIVLAIGAVTARTEDQQRALAEEGAREQLKILQARGQATGENVVKAAAVALCAEVTAEAIRRIGAALKPEYANASRDERADLLAELSPLKQ